MKNMRFCSLLVVAILVSVVVSGCKKDGTVSLRAKIANFGNESKVYLDNRTPRWSADDPVNVNDSLVLLRYYVLGCVSERDSHLFLQQSD